jgi:hypothetical protein
VKEMNVLRKLGMGNKRGMEMVQVAILVAIAVALGLVFKSQIGSFVDNTFQSLSNARF